VEEAAEYSYTATAADPDSDGLRITALLLPDWLTFSDNNDGTATLTGTPRGAEVGSHPVELQVEESAPAPGLAAQQSFVITVSAAADGPIVELLGAATVTITQGDEYTDAGATAWDLQDGDLTAQIAVDNPVDSGTPSTYTVTYSVSDSAGNAARAERTVTVRAEPIPVGEQSGSGGGVVGILEFFALLSITLAARLTLNRSRRRVSCVRRSAGLGRDNRGDVARRSLSAMR
jgi:hypothetical protein